MKTLYLILFVLFCCQAFYGQMNFKIPTQVGYNFYISKENFLLEEGEAFIICGNKYYPSFPKPFDTIKFSQDYLYKCHFSIHIDQKQILRVDSIKIGKSYCDSILKYAEKLFLLPKIAMKDFTQDENLLPFDIDEGDYSDAILDYCNIECKYSIFIENLNSKKGYIVNEIFNYLNRTQSSNLPPPNTRSIKQNLTEKRAAIIQQRKSPPKIRPFVLPKPTYTTHLKYLPF